MSNSALNSNSKAINDFEAFPVWNVSSVEIKSPSRYFALSPFGTGTEEVESLCSYIARLAEAHCVSPTRILFHSDGGETEFLPFSLKESSIPPTTALSINGMGGIAETVVSLIEKSTLMRKMNNHTFLPWKNLLSRYMLLRKSPAWCPACYEDQLRKQGFMYEKLVWVMSSVTVCTLHEILLTDNCPYCGSLQKYLGQTSRVGFCSWCKKWLGRVKDYDKNILVQNNIAQSIWIVQQIERLVACGTKIDQPVQAKEDFISNLRMHIDKRSFGSINDFAHLTGLWHINLRRVLQGETIPTIEMIIKICFALGMAFEDLFFSSNPYAQLKDACSTKPKECLEIVTPDSAIYEGVNESEKQIVEYLKKLLKDNPPISGREAARNLGWRDSKLYRKFPELYSQIVLRYKEFKKSGILATDDEVKEILQAASEENPPPSLQSVLRRFGCKNTGYRYQQKFSRICKRITQRFTAYRNRSLNDKNELNAFMKSVMVEIPPPSASQIAKRLKITRNRFQEKFPNQYKIIVSRFSEYTLQKRKNTFRKLEMEVEAIVRQVVAENIYPSEETVKARLSCGYNDGNFKKVLLKVRHQINNSFESNF